MSHRGRTIGVADTTYAEYDIAELAVEHVTENSEADISRYTTPGFPELPVAARRLIERHDCDIVLACSMVDSHNMNKEYAQRATEGFLRVTLNHDVHILEVAVGKDEARTKQGLIPTIEDRVRGHVENALALLEGKDGLRLQAGAGRRQDGDDTGSLREEYR